MLGGAGYLQLVSNSTHKSVVTRLTLLLGLIIGIEFHFWSQFKVPVLKPPGNNKLKLVHKEQIEEAKAQNGPKMVQHDPKMAPKWSKMVYKKGNEV